MYGNAKSTRLKAMRLLLNLLVPLGLVCTVLVGCDETKTTCPELDPPFEEISEEAKVIALCLSGEMRPPCSLSRTVERNLAAIRSNYAEQYAALDTLTFIPPWKPGCIHIDFDETTARMVQDGEYHDWDNLNRQFGLDTLDIHVSGSVGHASLCFEGLLHSRRLAEAYAYLPGVLGVRAGSYGIEGSPHQRLYPRRTGTRITYLFYYQGWISRYWYFRVRGSDVELVGTWREWLDWPPPDWWEEAKQNIIQSWMW